MKRHTKHGELVALLSTVLALSFVFLTLPIRVEAAFPTFETNPVLVGPQPIIQAETTFSAIKNAITAVATVTSSIANVALQIDKYVLEPIAFVTSGALLKAITASVINFVNGQTNGTGVPQFVQNLRGHLQATGDVQALSFLIEFGRNSNSPFASAISSSLRANYLQQTSLAGFFAANRDTLPQFSQNPSAFLAGDWSQGGASAWFALTTRGENNPYVLHERAQRELATLVYDASNATLADLSFGNGFFSWCGPSRTQDVSADNQGSGLQEVMVTSQVGTGTAAGDACTDKNGNPGFVQTPGSTIHDELTKALGTDIDKLTFMGSVGPEINTILGNIATVMNTLNFASNILGASGSGGLYGASQPYNGARSALENYQSPGYLGVTQQSISQNTAALPVTSQTMTSRINQYEAAWDTISSAVSAASSGAARLAQTCAPQQNAAETALIALIRPAAAQVQSASTTIAAARAALARLSADLSSTADGASGAYTADIQALQTMPPTAEDVATAQQDALAINAATASPDGSLAVSGGSLLDRMNLITQNAQALASACGAAQ